MPDTRQATARGPGTGCKNGPPDVEAGISKSTPLRQIWPEITQVHNTAKPARRTVAFTAALEGM